VSSSSVIGWERVPPAIGALLADADDATVAALAGFGTHLGLAFQAVDDLLGIWGAPEVTGKPTASDLRQAKKSFPVAAALEAGGLPGRRLEDLLAAPARSADEVREAALLVEELGGRERTRHEAESDLEAAMAAVAAARIAPGPRRDLEDLARFVTAREF
jgi:geranylgeranyl diphosphate synthase type I